MVQSSILQLGFPLPGPPPLEDLEGVTVGVGVAVVTVGVTVSDIVGVVVGLKVGV